MSRNKIVTLMIILSIILVFFYWKLIVFLGIMGGLGYLGYKYLKKTDTNE